MIYLYGAGGHAKVVLEIVEAQQIPIGGIWDDAQTGKLLGHLILGKFDPANLPADHQLIIAIGNNKYRKEIAGKYPHLRYALGVHPFAYVSPSVVIGIGTAVMAGVSINAESKIGQHCILNTNCSVDHDNQIGNFVHISPNAALAGNVSVGEGTHIGIGASVIQGIKIGKWATIGAGAVIIKDIPDFAVVVGNPGRIIK